MLGIVAEFNPFHNGHKYLIDTAINIVKPDITICSMSGNFVQHGEPAIFDKFTRAGFAIENNIDIVFEIPVYFSIATAEDFANASLSIFKNAGATHIAFGVEDDNLELLVKIAKLLCDEPPEYRSTLKSCLDSGLSFAKSRENAVSSIIPNNILDKPNNILAVEYLKAIYKLNLDITPILIKRQGATHNDKTINSNFMSGTKIRDLIKNPLESTSLCNILPYELSSQNPVFFDDFEEILLYKLRIISRDDLSNIFDVTEGLDNRIFTAIKKYNSVSDMLNYIKTKRYPMSRIKRIFLSILLDIDKKSYNLFKESGFIQYLRILKISNKGLKYLNILSKISNIPVITSLKNFYENPSNNLSFNMLLADIQATNIYTIASHNTMNLDFSNHITD